MRIMLIGRLIVNRKPPTEVEGFNFKVVPPGIEPGTQGFSVLCSTN